METVQKIEEEGQEDNTQNEGEHARHS